MVMKTDLPEKLHGGFLYVVKFSDPSQWDKAFDWLCKNYKGGQDFQYLPASEMSFKDEALAEKVENDFCRP